MLESVRAQKREVIGFTSGDAGSFTRVLAPVFGSKWTYAAPAIVAGMSTGDATAPGQLRPDELRARWPIAGVTRETRVFAVLGRPAIHSLSPAVHGALLRATGLDAVYLAIEPDDLSTFLRLCRSPSFSGFSVTAPFKTAAYAFAEHHDADTHACRAANTLIRGADGTWTAQNTDAPAIRIVMERALDRAGKTLADSSVLVIGTGGAARAAIVALQSGRVTVAGRDIAERARLATEFRIHACSPADAASLEFDVIVHCTPLGSRAHPFETAIDSRALRQGMIVLDAVYRPVRTPLIIEAERAGAIGVPGTEWFVAQAVLQFESFTQQTCDVAVVRDALEKALASDTSAGVAVKRDIAP